MNRSFGISEMSAFVESNYTVSNLNEYGFNTTIFDDNDYKDNFTSYGGSGNNTYFTHVSVLKYMQQVVNIFGVIANVLIITVLPSKNIKSPIYSILLALAVADIMVLLNEFFINLTDFPLISFCNYYYECAVALRITDEFNVISHITSAWLTVVVAVWRYMSQSYPDPTERWRSPKRANVAIVSTFASCIMLEAPRFWFMKVVTKRYNDTFLHIIIGNKTFIEKWSEWVDAYQMFFTIVLISACVLLTVLIVGLIRSLYKVNKKIKVLKLTSEDDDSNDRPTKMLIVIVVIFLLTNVPRALKYPINSLTHDAYLRMLIGEIIFFLTIVNSSVNFNIYYVMSSVFRETFVSVVYT